MRIIILFFLTIILISFHPSLEKNKIILGSKSSKNCYVYLCGLCKEFDYTKNNRQILDDIGKKNDIKIIAIKPKDRCINLYNMLCWPHDNKQQTIKTYEYIKKALNNENINGYIGFSNGGFFLLELAKIINLDKPIIAIGAGGYIEKTEAKNNIIMLIGKKDKYHYDCAKQYYEQSKNTSLNVTLIEYNQGHTIPKKILEKVIQF